MNFKKTGLLLTSALVLVVILALAPRPVHIFMAGDSTMANKPYFRNVTDSLTGESIQEQNLERGWGQFLSKHFAENIVVRNMAKNGKSTKSFRSEGIWNKLLSEMQKGDFVVIQFGHNDSSLTKSARTTEAEYKANIERFVDEVRAKGGKPILCTSVVRRKFIDAKLVDTHGTYPDIVRAIAKVKQVPLVDLQASTSAWLAAEGEQKSNAFFHKLAKGVSRSFPKGLDDNTHFNEAGASKVASLFAAGISELNNSGLEIYLKSNQKPYVSKVWVSDLGNGNYKNPVLYADYSDPDVCRVGKDYYMTASSFANLPGLPLLHSNDLVNWTLIGYALDKMVPEERFNTLQHGNGIWAPSIRYHNNEFYIYVGDPDAGLYMTKAKNIEGPWEPLTMVKAGKGLIDCCPFWDEDGRAYVAHGFAGSRAGMKSVLAVFEMTTDGKKAISESRLVFDGHPAHPTTEGAKIYKRNGYYYIFSPAGGVKPGWQLVMRSTNIYGPYEEKIVMAQGKSNINGPHQGAWVDTPDGKEDWFLHFQDVYAYGRVVHLNPMRWVNDWPVIGVDKDGDGCGDPVETYKKPNVGKTYPIATPIESDEFDGLKLGLQWQWQANEYPLWYFAHGSKGFLRLFAWESIGAAKNLWDAPALLLQKFPAPDFKATTKLTFSPFKRGERAGLVVMGQDYATLTIDSVDKGLALSFVTCKNAPNGTAETVHFNLPLTTNTVYLRVVLNQTRAMNKEKILQPKANCTFSYSLDGNKFTELNIPFAAWEGKWIGAKVGIFCQRPKPLNDSGYADFDWFRIEK